MVELPKTETELQTLIDDAIKKATDTLKSEYDGKFAAQRKKHDEEIAKIKADAGKSAEELAEERLKEQREKDANELTELRNFKKQTIIGDRLAKENLPSYFKNDNRLINAEEGDLDKVVKDIKKEFEASLPRGNQVSTVINTNGSGGIQPTKTEGDVANELLADTLSQIIGK